MRFDKHVFTPADARAWLARHGFLVDPEIADLLMTRREPMRVEQVMTKDVKSCPASDSLNVAARIMWDRDCGCVPVA